MPKTPSASLCVHLVRSVFSTASMVFLATCLSPGLMAAEAPVLPTRTQVIELHQGWNAVWLEVEPLDLSADVVFAGTAVDVCARFFRPAQTLEFIKDPSEKPFNQEGWGVWYAPAREDALVKTLEHVNGQAAYLIHATQAATWSVTGSVRFKAAEWKHGAFTLAGFSVDAAHPPTFAEFFAGSGGTVGSQIFRLIEGRWQRVLGTETMRSGEACWIYAEGDSHYQGPLTVDLKTAVCDFGSNTGIVSLTHVNTSSVAHTVTAEVVAAGSSPAGAADLPLLRVELDTSTLLTTSSPLTGALPELAVGLADTLPMQVQRGLMTAPVQTALLKLSDGRGALVWVPVRAFK